MLDFFSQNDWRDLAILIAVPGSLFIIWAILVWHWLFGEGRV